MNTETKKILVAIAWPYVNGDIHLGHLAGYLFPADLFARYHRLRGNDVLMVSGSDCHGTPITVQADKEGKSPEEIVEKYHKQDLDLFDQYDLSYNLYTKTTTDNHKKVSQGVFLDLLANDYIVKDKMMQYYSPSEDKFLPDRYVEGTCPHCDAKEQRSDQCENCGRWLKDGELINPVSKLSGEKVELKETEHYFLDFPKLEDELKEYTKDKDKIWREWVFKETRGWLEEGLQKRAITRDMDWAIELPNDQIADDKKLEGFENKRLYVWFEAVIGYLSAPQEWSELVQEIDDKYSYDKTSDYLLRTYKGQSKDWKDWWLNPDAEIYNFMGQDNLVFHTLMWPGELIGTKKGYTLPHNVVVNKFMNFNEAKFSKSRGNVVDSKEIAEEFGTDAVRYFVISNMPENKETNFTWERFIDSVNNELIADFGNYINRTLVFYQRQRSAFGVQHSAEISEEVRKEIEGALKETLDYLEKCEFVNAMKRVMKLASFGNKYFNDSEIWKVIKEDETKAGQVMLDLINIVEALRILMRPFLPEAFKSLSEMVGVEIEEPEVGKDYWKFEPIAGYDIEEVRPLFKKIDREKTLKLKVKSV